MKYLTRIAPVVALLSLSLIARNASADATVTVDTGQNWIAFMNVWNLDRTGALPAPILDEYQFGSGWGVADTTAVFDRPNAQLTLGPNVIGDPNEYWYIGGGAPGSPGNKWMEANTFVQVDDDSLSGMTVTFEGFIESNTLTDNHTAYVFIRDFAPDFSSSNDNIVEIADGDFSISLATDPGTGRHVQYGFQMQGENVWITDVAPFGTVVVSTVPEPTALATLGLCAAGMVWRRRRRS